ncbi:cell division protein FtsQ [candidate division KSB1 bacterium]|nr:cell division protein FtsQ [candidate division KSB1 bacterium]RQW04360.1 MAG: cell division protein FtsQ [candidate division KSB1 bacterium]
MTNVNQKIERFGRLAAVLSSIVLSALVFNLWVLKATASEPKMRRAEPHPNMGAFEEEKTLWLQKLYNSIVQSGTATAAIPASEISDLAPSNFGKPVAYVNIDKLYLITKTGKIMGAADSCEFYDLPVISSDSFLLEKNGRRLIDQGTKNALHLLGELENNDALKSFVSEIKIEDKNLIVYMNLGKVIPVLFGEGGWEQKIKNFVSYQKQLGASELTKKALYLDLRVENHIIVKKNV